MDTCLCYSGNSYETCCKPYHEGVKAPENALKLMRSRYSAYALNLSDYIIATTHPENPYYEENLEAWKENIAEFASTNTFDGLEIVDFQEKGNKATVTFLARLTEGDQDSSFCEKSLFEKVGGKWLYKSGEAARPG